MGDFISRRNFMARAGLASAALAAGPAILAAQDPPAGKQASIAMVGGSHIHSPGAAKMVEAHQDVVKVVAVWDPDAAVAKKRAEELGGVKVVATAEEIFANKEIAGVMIYSQTSRHLELVKAAAAAGKHMFVEKPLGMTGAESREMADAVEKAGVMFSTGYFNRSLREHIFLREQVQKGVFGKITRVRGSNCHNGSLGGWFDTEWRWMADPRQAGFGAFGDLGTHMLDILMWIFGDVAEVTADIKPVTHRYGDTDECGEALIRFKSGVTGSLAAGWVDLADPMTLMISGTEGHAAILNGRLFIKSAKLEGADGKRQWTQFPDPQSHPLELFLEAVGGKKDQPLVPVREAAARVTVMEAMYQASKERKWVGISQ